MENEIKKLMEKWGKKYRDLNGIGANISTVNLSKMALDDFLSLIAFKKKNCCGKTAENGINKVYERFKHLDVLLSDPVAMNEDKDPIHSTCYDLWKVIKAEAIENG